MLIFRGLHHGVSMLVRCVGFFGCFHHSMSMLVSCHFFEVFHHGVRRLVTSLRCVSSSGFSSRRCVRQDSIVCSL
ncbi:hypothetical protein QBC43DRAFT_326016, partial [Cladorrhinum sp. PSN259]